MQPLKSQLFAKGGEIYEISDEYNSSVTGFSGDYEYYGYLNVSGKWIIQRHTISTGSWRYVNGSSSYLAAWTNKAILSGYDYYNLMSSTIP